jgi:hypothetical protein
MIPFRVYWVVITDAVSSNEEDEKSFVGISVMGCGYNSLVMRAQCFVVLLDHPLTYFL